MSLFECEVRTRNGLLYRTQLGHLHCSQISSYFIFTTDILGHELVLLCRATTWPEMWNSHVPAPGILWLFTIPAPTLWPCTASKRWNHGIFLKKRWSGDMEKSIINFLPILSLLASFQRQGQGGYLALLINVAEPDPYVFGPLRSGFISTRYRSGSFYHQAKIVRKTLIPTICDFFYDFLSLKMM
jgi:hypothetical protein